MKQFSSLLTILLLMSCQKEVLTKPVHFNNTNYAYLGTWDSTSRPTYLLSREQIDPAMLSFISKTLPEAIDLRTSSPDLLTTKAIADIAITERSDVFMTFVAQGAGLPNALAFYTYPTNNPPASPDDIETITYIFPNAGHLTPLWAGDKVKIGTFGPGISIGFVLMQNSWMDQTKKLNNDVVHFCSNDVLNPEVDFNLKKHAVLINYSSNIDKTVLIGFEDLDRTTEACDHDFNDVVVYATVARP